MVEERIYTEEFTLSGNADFNLSLGAAHSFMYEVGDGYSFGFKPGLVLEYDLTPTDALSIDKYVETDITDANANGTYTDPGDTYDVTTIEFTNTQFSSGLTSSDTSTFTTVFSCPVAFQAQPEDWFMGLTLGSRPQISYSYAVTKSSGQSSETTNEDKIAGTSLVNETLSATSETRNTTKTWTVSADYNMGVYFDLSENVRFDVDVSAAVASGVWDFQNLTVQAIIALP